MKIESVSTIKSISVATDEEEYSLYIRHSADCWEVQMNNSTELHYPCEDIEALYQEYISKKEVRGVVK